MKFRLAAFADEADRSVEGQIAALTQNNIGFVELRGIDGENVTDISTERLREAQRKFEAAGIGVWSIGSSIGKTDISADFSAELDRFRRVLEKALLTGASCIRLFSFYGTGGREEYRDEVCFRLSELAAAARGSGVILCHENEKGVYGDIPRRCAELHSAIPQLRGCFDPANYIQCGVDPSDAWETVGGDTFYMHIKDARRSDGAVVAPGEGDARLCELLKKYYLSGGVTLTLEPHLRVFTGLSALESRSRDKSAVGSHGFSNGREAFDFAINALNNIINKIDIDD